MTKQEIENQERMETCPRFQSCSCPQCPLDEFIGSRTKLEGEPACPYLTNRRGRRIRPIPMVVKRFLKPSVDGGYKSIFEKTSPEERN